MEQRPDHASFDLTALTGAGDTVGAVGPADVDGELGSGEPGLAEPGPEPGTRPNLTKRRRGAIAAGVAVMVVIAVAAALSLMRATATAGLMEPIGGEPRLRYSTALSQVFAGVAIDSTHTVSWQQAARMGTGTAVVGVAQVLVTLPVGQIDTRGYNSADYGPMFGTEQVVQMWTPQQRLTAVLGPVGQPRWQVQTSVELPQPVLLPGAVVTFAQRDGAASALIHEGATGAVLSDIEVGRGTVLAATGSDQAAWLLVGETHECRIVTIRAARGSWQAQQLGESITPCQNSVGGAPIGLTVGQEIGAIPELGVTFSLKTGAITHLPGVETANLLARDTVLAMTPSGATTVIRNGHSVTISDEWCWGVVNAVPQVRENLFVVASCAGEHPAGVVDLRTGAMVWRAPAEDYLLFAVGATVVAVRGASTGEPALVGRDIAGGNVLWSDALEGFPTVVGTDGTAVVVHQRVAVAPAQEARIAAIDARTGEQLWSFDAPGGVSVFPIDQAPAVMVLDTDTLQWWDI